MTSMAAFMWTKTISLIATTAKEIFRGTLKKKVRVKMIMILPVFRLMERVTAVITWGTPVPRRQMVKRGTSWRLERRIHSM